MKRLLTACLLACIASGTAFAAEDLTKLADEVRATEIAFAKTLADRDVKTFRRMIAPDVIWLADKPLRGPDEVLTRWQKFFDAPQAPFSWSPELVEVQEGGKLALSTGPVFDAAGKRVATYTSIWRREPTGEWRIVFDRGCPACDCKQ
jgi:ketosteroid isomerase-like protein